MDLVGADAEGGRAVGRSSLRILTSGGAGGEGLGVGAEGAHGHVKDAAAELLGSRHELWARFDKEFAAVGGDAGDEVVVEGERLRRIVGDAVGVRFEFFVLQPKIGFSEQDDQWPLVGFDLT